MAQKNFYSSLWNYVIFSPVTKRDVVYTFSVDTSKSTMSSKTAVSVSTTSAKGITQNKFLINIYNFFISSTIFLMKNQL